MDIEFLDELDKTVTHIGTDRYWKKKIGDHELWFSPISFTSQSKANELLSSSSELGPSILAETKRVTLSHAIVGVNQFDLRKYRDAGPVFPSKNKEGKNIKITLDKYIYGKIAGWETEFVDIAFDVFADLMQSNKEHNLKDVKFDNLKEPRDELVELEAKVASLRIELGLPPLIEAAARPEEEEEEQAEADSELPEDFDPFKKITQTESESEPKLEPEPEPEPVMSVPVPIPPELPVQNESPIMQEVANRRRSQRLKQNFKPVEGAKNTPETAHQSLPSVTDKIIEEPAERKRIAPPVINPNPAQQSRNPRFNPQK